MKKNLALLFAVLSYSNLLLAAPSFISVDSEVLEKIRPHLSMQHTEIFVGEKATILKLSEKQILDFSGAIHHNLNRCGGFAGFQTLEEAKSSADNNDDAEFGAKAIFTDYLINQQALTAPMMEQVSELEICNMILKLSGFGTRLYSSKEGVASSTYIRDQWAKMTSLRNDVVIEMIKHRGYNQPTIVLTITGSEQPEEIVILGGHADSISSGYEAPGADDNASGIATMTETLRVLIANNIKPKKTLQFMAYAAEEVGLWGSQDVARSYRKSFKNVVGVMLLDMTLFKGTKEKDILLTTDYTNKVQNDFLGKLIDEYVKVPWGHTTCGYGCSDHASWTSSGFPASYPQEAYMEQSNAYIHTEMDTLEMAGGNALHATKFAKLAIAFMMELGN